MLVSRFLSRYPLLAFVAGVIARPHAGARQMANAPVVLAAEWLGDYWAVLGGHGKILVFLAIAARYLSCVSESSSAIPLAVSHPRSGSPQCSISPRHTAPMVSRPESIRR